MVQQIVQKPLSFFKADPNQPRKLFDDAELLLLGESLKNIGQQVPCLATSDGTLIDGERRWRAGKRVSLAGLNVIITDEKLSAIDIQLVNDAHRVGFSAVERYWGYKEWLRQNPHATFKELAARIHVDTATMSRILSLDKGIPIVQKAAHEGKIGPAHWAAICAAPPEAQEGLLNLRLAGAGREEIRAARRPKLADAVKLASVSLPLPNGVIVSMKGKQIGMTQIIENLQELVKLAKKAHDDGLNVKTFALSCKDKAPKK